MVLAIPPAVPPAAKSSKNDLAGWRFVDSWIVLTGVSMTTVGTAGTVVVVVVVDDMLLRNDDGRKRFAQRQGFTHELDTRVCNMSCLKHLQPPHRRRLQHLMAP
jgi:hypothetical protein